MAAWLNKWLLAVVAPVMWFSGEQLVSTSNPVQSPGTGLPHPFHVSVVEINHNQDDKTLEISCKIFTDDFEKVLVQNYKTKVDLINPPANRESTDKFVGDYIKTHLTMKVDGQPVIFNYLGFEREDDAIYTYIEVKNLISVKKLEIINKIMYDFFDDQTNIIHVTVGGKRQSKKLEYPAMVSGFSF